MSRERRGLFQEEESSAEPGHFGCPMLTRGHGSHPTRPGQLLMRCCLGWALHDDVDVARCSAIDSPIDCWKVHPERTPLVVIGTAGSMIPGGHEQKASAD